MSSAPSTQEQDTILRAVVVSSSSTWSGQVISSQDRQAAFAVLTEFSNYAGRVPFCLQWLQQPQLVVQGNDCTLPVKLYACEILTTFLKHQYSKLSEQDRIQLKQAAVMAARLEAPKPRTESTILANKLASLLAALLVREFPQRWTTCIDDLFAMWNPDQPQIGNKLCLEVLKLVAEDCTDSDFNTKISTKRRNDILIGLNEVSSQFLPLLFRSLEHIVSLTQARSNLHNMRTYLVQNQQTLQSMTPDQESAYRAEEKNVSLLALTIVDTLSTMEKFCRSMPLDWILTPPYDFSAAFIHLMREPTENINLVALECLEQLCVRGKLTYSTWIQWIQEFPGAVQNANRQLNMEQEYKVIEARVSGQEPVDALTSQFEFHRALSRMLAAVVSSHIAHVTQSKKILDGNTLESSQFSNYLSLLVDMLYHPSGKVVTEQLALWVSLHRDPQISNKKHRLLRPFAAQLATCFMDQMLRLRWEDIEEQTHPNYAVLEASWDDEEEYDTWLMEYRSKATQFFKYLGNCEPQISSEVISARVIGLLGKHGNGEPRNHLHPKSGQLTVRSEAVRQLEGIVQPLENILSGLPSWSLSKPDNETPGARSQIRVATQAALSEMARAIVNWNPTYLWLQMRRAQFLDALKHYWVHDPSTLLQGVDSLFGYIRVPDEWVDDNVDDSEDGQRISGETIGLRKKSSSSLISIAKKVPHHLVPWLTQLSEATRSVLASGDLLPSSRMHLYEFLSCVATAVDDPIQRASFVDTVLSDAISTIQSPSTMEAISSVPSFLTFLGVSQATQNPSSVVNQTQVNEVSARFSRMFSAFNELLSVGRRCHEAAKQRPNGGFPNLTNILRQQASSADPNQPNSFPDEGPVSLQDLAFDDPFVPLWPRIFPSMIKAVDVFMKLWSPEHQSVLLRDKIQRYVLAMSDDDAYLARKTDGKSGGVFGEGGTAGSIIPGTDRRAMNLAPRWSCWLNEFRNALLQMLGLMAAQRVLFAPEMAPFFPELVSVVTDSQNLRAMEHRHCTQFLKQFIEILLLACPITLYSTHLAPIVGPILEHLQHRLELSWDPILKGQGASPRPLFCSDCDAAAQVASQGGDIWYASYYARSGLFVGDLDGVTAEAAVEKQRVEITRTFGDVLQAALALKGEWALVLANLAKEEMNSKRNDTTNQAKSSKAHPNQLTEGEVNADGTPKRPNQAAIDARKLARITAMCHFLFLEHEQIAGFITLTVIQCLGVPDAYTCRRVTKICHRLLETAAWHPRYTELLANRMLSMGIHNLVTEPKWMVGIEWDMINVVRDLYLRLSLGQVMQPGGQGPGLQQATVSENPVVFEQAKTAEKPLLGGGILTTPSDLPRQVFLSLPGVTVEMVRQMDAELRQKRAAKDQKDCIRDVLRIAADQWSEAHPTESSNVLDRAVGAESLLHRGKADIEDIPEKLVTQSMVNKKKGEAAPHGLGAFELFGK
eukprot:Nitzschia sp. Nitz4//scaffold105_size73764//38086//42509//NITZ4_005677-RA/size73764-augustus-gene-0.51-mRNA-1//1//CDS//3329532450//7791//frame0